MVELTVLNGSEPGRLLRLNRFPTRVGRRCEGEGLLVGPGIWDHHFDVVREESGRFGLVVAKGARVAMEGEFIERSTLKNGGILEAGGLRLRFSVGVSTQRPLKLRERVVWMGAGILLLLEAWMIVWVGR